MAQLVCGAFVITKSNICRRPLLCAFVPTTGALWQMKRHPISRSRSYTRGADGHSVATDYLQSEEGLSNARHASRSSNDNLSPDRGTSSNYTPNVASPSHKANSASLPWYLQAKQSSTAAELIADSQRLPELPPSPPEILLPLLKHLSVDIGLDDLKLLDLRKLDPPPALGANLLMIIGTARSEKHLHVSADRFCRWLRSEYKIRPDADGLLGRQELKLKLKRKARRSKLTGGLALEEEVDDGIRTGWVCVTVGPVEGASLVADETPLENDNFVGFGRRTNGVKIVVQMLLKDKRLELDLERLWTGIARREHDAGFTSDDYGNSNTSDNVTAPS